MYGYEIIQNFEDRGIKLNTAILYPALKNLDEMGLVESYKSEQSRGAKKRKNYILTEDGFTFISSLFDMSFVPDYYLQSFEEQINEIKGLISNKRTMVIDSTNFLDAKALFSTKYFYKFLPRNIDFMRYYDFKEIENDSLEPRDYIFVLFPFFIQYEINETFYNYLDNFFLKVKDLLDVDGEAWILDLYWERNAIIDTFTYLIANEVRKMGFNCQEMKEYLKKFFNNFRIIKQKDGVILFSVS
jgi:DNA-binding PadR family transcriptional regulator